MPNLVDIDPVVQRKWVFSITKIEDGYDPLFQQTYNDYFSLEMGAAVPLNLFDFP